jgi:hypothetical protein
VEVRLRVARLLRVPDLVDAMLQRPFSSGDIAMRSRIGMASNEPVFSTMAEASLNACACRCRSSAARSLKCWRTRRSVSSRIFGVRHPRSSPASACASAAASVTRRARCSPTRPDAVRPAAALSPSWRSPSGADRRRRRSDGPPIRSRRAPCGAREVVLRGEVLPRVHHRLEDPACVRLTAVAMRPGTRSLSPFRCACSVMIAFISAKASVRCSGVAAVRAELYR